MCLSAFERWRDPWQSDFECCSLANDRLYLHGATQHLANNGVHDTHPQTRASSANLGAEERLEQMQQNALGNAHPVVSKLQRDLLLLAVL